MLIALRLLLEIGADQGDRHPIDSARDELSPPAIEIRFQTAEDCLDGNWEHPCEVRHQDLILLFATFKQRRLPVRNPLWAWRPRALHRPRPGRRA